MEYKKHRFNIYPEMQPEEFDRLRANLMSNGYDAKNPIWLFEDEILDGWNRYRACLALNINPVFKTFEGSELDAMQFTIRTNDRRDLSSSQRAAIAVDAEELVVVLKAEAKARYLQGVKTGGEVAGNNRPKEISSVEQIPQSNNPELNKVRTQLAQTFGTNPRYVSDAAKIKAENPEAFKEIKAGKKTITDFKKEDKQKKQKQEQEKKKSEIEAKAKEVSEKNPDLTEKILFGDSRELVKQYPDGIKLIFTDPPYGMDFQSNRREISEKAEKIANDESIEKALELCAQVLEPLMLKVAKDSAILMWCNWKYEPEFRFLLDSFGYQIKNSIIWVKNNHGSGDLQGSFAPKHERLLFAVRGEIKFNDLGRLPDVLEGSEFLKTTHPTPKPIDLISKIITRLTFENEIVVDPFIGSGSTAIAAIRNNRIFYGSEISEQYWKEAIVNVQNFQK